MTARLQLSAKLDTRAAAGLAEELRGNAGSDLTVDASAVTHFGALALQTLMVAGAAWTAAGQSLTLEHLSDEATDQFRLFGVTPEGLMAGKAGV